MILQLAFFLHQPLTAAGIACAEIRSSAVGGDTTKAHHRGNANMCGLVLVVRVGLGEGRWVSGAEAEESGSSEKGTVTESFSAPLTRIRDLKLGGVLAGVVGFCLASWLGLGGGT